MARLALIPGEHIQGWQLRVIFIAQDSKTQKQKVYVKGKNHINGLEGFWDYLKRKLAAKGGVQRQYLPLFLGEYVFGVTTLSGEVNFL